MPEFLLARRWRWRKKTKMADIDTRDLKEVKKNAQKSLRDFGVSGKYNLAEWKLSALLVSQAYYCESQLTVAFRAP